LHFIHNHSLAIDRTMAHIAKALWAGSQLSEFRIYCDKNGTQSIFILSNIVE
jgi:hypothetical protein